MRLKQGTPNYPTSFEVLVSGEFRTNGLFGAEVLASLRGPRPQSLMLKSYSWSSDGKGSSDMNLRMTFSVILETLLSQLFSSREPHQAMELEENMPPPSLVVK